MRSVAELGITDINSIKKRFELEAVIFNKNLTYFIKTSLIQNSELVMILTIKR